MKTACALISLYLTAAAQAALIIDHFDSPDNGQVVSLDAPDKVGASAESTVMISSVLGGYRKMSITVIEFLNPVGYLSASAHEHPDFFKASSGAAYTFSVKLTYDSDGGNLNASLSSFSGFLISGVQQDPTTIEYKVSITSEDKGTAFAKATKGGGFSGDILFSKGDFVNTVGVVDWGDIDKIVVTANPLSRGGDFRFDSIALIPEPKAATVAGLACLVGALARHRSMCRKASVKPLVWSPMGFDAQ